MTNFFTDQAMVEEEEEEEEKSLFSFRTEEFASKKIDESDVNRKPK